MPFIDCSEHESLVLFSVSRLNVLYGVLFVVFGIELFDLSQRKDSVFVSRPLVDYRDGFG